MMKKTLLQLLTLGVLVLTAACSKDDDNSTEIVVGPNDIASGVYCYNQQIVLADRNLGATEIGGVGSYLTRAEAAAACPEGYHLMTKPEAKALIADSRYSTIEKFLAAFKMPVVQYTDIPPVLEPESRIFLFTDVAFYNLRNNSMSCDPERGFRFNVVPPIFKLNSRCVKGKDQTPIQSTSATGSAQLPNGTTMNVRGAGIDYEYSDEAQTQLAAHWIVLTPTAPTDNYEDEPDEYISLELTYTESGKIEIAYAYYKKGSNRNDLLSDNSNSTATLALNRSKRTFTLSFEVKDNANATIVKGSCQGTFVDMGDEPYRL